ncbi:MAG: hypothetical protein JO181_17885, partial [Solirubrobacterales bacterium]|nr:hypothetical protein [Solirubrobacterales bacterium]
WQSVHPDWIVYRCDRKTPAYYSSNATNVPLDITNPAVRAWQMAQLADLFGQGATGVAFDNFNFANADGRCGVYRNGVWTPLRYPRVWQDNAQYAGDMLAWLRAISSAVRQEYPGKTITVSLSPSVSGLANVKASVPYIDMIFDESGYTDYGKKRLTGSAWQTETSALEYLNRQGKGFDVNAIVDEPRDSAVTSNQLNWALANYLLVRGARSYTYVYGGKGLGFSGSPSGYGTFFDRPDYHVPIGHPVAGPYVSHGLQMRAYSGGLVIVDARRSATYTIRLDRIYNDMGGHAISSARLSPATGIVLLSPSRAKPRKGSLSRLCPSPRFYEAPLTGIHLSRRGAAWHQVVLSCPAG